MSTSQVASRRSRSSILRSWVITTGGYRRRTSGRSSGCCSHQASAAADPDARFRDFRTRYAAFKEQHPDRKPLSTTGATNGRRIPKHFLSRYDEDVAKKGRHDFNPNAKYLSVLSCRPGRRSQSGTGHLAQRAASGFDIELSDARRILATRKRAGMPHSNNPSTPRRTKGDALSKRFEEALKQAKKNPSRSRRATSTRLNVLPCSLGRRRLDLPAPIAPVAPIAPNTRA